MQVIHVLLVDDDPDILNLFEAPLTSADIGVDRAASGEEAIEKLNSYVPELIISDIKMGGMDGYELCRRVREMGLNEIPFFFCSALGSIPQRVQGLKIGADDYLVKPVNPIELLFRVQSQLSKNTRLREVRMKAASGGEGHILSGRIEELSPGEVLQMVAMTGRSHLRIRFEDTLGAPGHIFLGEREVIHAEYRDYQGQKALFRILELSEGTYSVDTHICCDAPTISDTLDSWVLRGMVQLDEYRLLRKSLEKIGKGRCDDPKRFD